MRTLEGRRLRRSVLKGAVVAFITAGETRCLWQRGGGRRSATCSMLNVVRTAI